MPARADRRAVGGLITLGASEVTICPLDRFLSGCVRPSMEFLMQVSFLPPSRLVAGLCRGLSFNDRLMDVPSGNLGCIEKCKSDMGCGLVCKVCLTSVS